jgi:beta-lactamase class A
MKALVIILALVIGWFGHGYYISHYEDVSEVIQLRENSPEYRFINPLILVADNRDLHFEKYENLESKVSDYIEKNLKKGNADKISFYFRDLNGGEWVGVNEEDKFAPASLLKVATMMAFLKLADKDSRTLLEEVLYEPKAAMSQYYKPRSLPPGSYSAKALLRQMIVESDNDAMHSLHTLHAGELVEIYQDLGLPDPFSDEEPVDFLSPREYSRFFRTFYNGAYISHFYSNEALELLASTRFKEGLAGGVPPNMVIANKFGEYSVSETQKQLHDCGIVYYPEKPYFVCVMTKGGDFDKLAGIIKEISKIVYEGVHNQK